MLVCSKCGGKNIQKLAWIDANTDKYMAEGTNNYEDKWCEDCQYNTIFVEYEHYLSTLVDDSDEEFYDEIFG